MRPHLENVRAFLYGLNGSKVLRYQGKTLADTGCTMTFEHLGLGPEMALAKAETAELTDEDLVKIRAYRDSGTDIWSRDLSLLNGAAKFELEVMDPVQLRALVTGVLDRVLDQAQLDQIAADEQAERETLADRFSQLASQLDGDEDDQAEAEEES